MKVVYMASMAAAVIFGIAESPVLALYEVRIAEVVSQTIKFAESIAANASRQIFLVSTRLPSARLRGTR